jgi:predicted nucleic-acid-binding Zn-ribbon protein
MDKHKYLSEDIFEDLKPNSVLEKDILEAFNNLVVIEFFELNDNKFYPIINKNCHFSQTIPDGFYADDSIDNTNPLELFSKIRTIADTKDEDRKKKLLLEVQKEFGIKS